MFRHITAILLVVSLIGFACGPKPPSPLNTNVTPNLNPGANPQDNFGATSCTSQGGTYDPTTDLCSTAGPAAVNTAQPNTPPSLTDRDFKDHGWNYVLVGAVSSIVSLYLWNACMEKDGDKAGQPCDWTPWNGGTAGASPHAGAQTINGVTVQIPTANDGKTWIKTWHDGTSTHFRIKGVGTLTDKITIDKIAYGNQAAFCIHAKQLNLSTQTVTSTTHPLESGYVLAQLQDNFDSFLQYSVGNQGSPGQTAQLGKTFDEMTALCDQNTSSLVGIGVGPNPNTFAVYKINPLALGWNLASTNRAIKVASTKLIFENLGVLLGAPDPTVKFQAPASSLWTGDPPASSPFVQSKAEQEVLNALNPLKDAFNACGTEYPSDKTSEIKCEMQVLLSKPPSSPPPATIPMSGFGFSS
ncbi:MAG: hypothetical protein V1798_02795 [Pseudomonadota bacterium]